MNPVTKEKWLKNSFISRHSPSPVTYIVLLYLPSTWQEMGRLHAGQLYGHGGPRAKPGLTGEPVLKAPALPNVG